MAMSKSDGARVPRRDADSVAQLSGGSVEHLRCIENCMYANDLADVASAQYQAA
jgi:hypothetical protein